MIRVTMTSQLSQQRNDALTYYTCSNFSHWELFLQNSSQELFPPIASRLNVREVKTESVSALS